MKHFYLKNLSIRFACFTILCAAFIINSCRKDSKNASQAPLPLAISQAKTWYESTYPINPNGKLTTQSINSPFDLSQIMKPDWNHASSYARLGKNVIEMPIDSSSAITSALENKATGQALYPKENSRSYLLLLNDGKNYEAYIMTILADPAYLKGDQSKLAKNTYRKHDIDFTGFVFYFTPKGQYVSGFEFKDGQLLTPAPQNAPSSGQVIQNINNSNLKPTVEQPPSYDCIFYYMLTYENGVLVSQQFLYAVCTPTPGGGSGTSGGSGSGGTNTAPPPPPCPGSGGTGTESVSSLHLGIDVTQPPPGDGGMPPPTSTPCTITTPAGDTVKVAFCSGLTSAERTSIQRTIDAFKTEDCASSFLYNYFDGQSFSFCISPGNYNVIYNPQNNSFTFSTDAVATPTYASLLEHEFFHAFQNATYPGGITAYGQNASTGVNSAGFVNIEFEQAVFNDIATGNYSAFANGTQQQQSAYQNWIKGLTVNGTTYPKLSPSSANYAQFINDYNSFLNQYNALPNNPNESSIINLVPQAFINLFNTVSPNC